MTPPLTWRDVLVGLLRRLQRRTLVQLQLSYGHRPMSAMLREAEGLTCSGCSELRDWMRHGQRGILTIEHNGPCDDEGRKYVHWGPGFDRSAYMRQVLRTAGRR